MTSAQAAEMGIIQVKAADLKVGMQVVEADGGLITVDSVSVIGKMVVATCSSMMQRGINLRARASKTLCIQG